MKTKYIIIVCLISAMGFSQSLQLKTISNEEMLRIKNTTPLRIIPFTDNSNRSTNVSKTRQSNISDKIETTGPAITSSGKNCVPNKVTYSICSDKLTPISTEMGIRLGTVFDLNLFRQGNYTPVSYSFNSEGLIYVGGAATSSQRITQVAAGTQNTDFQVALNTFTRSVNSPVLTQRMSRDFNIVYGINESQLNAKLGFGYSDALGNEANINSNLDLTSRKQKYTMIYKEENYYEELDMGGNLLMAGAISNPNLVYVSKVIYGKLGFFEYNSSEDYMKFGLKANGTYNQNGASFSATVSLDMLSSDSEGEITAKLFGSRNDSKIPVDKTGFINWVDESPTRNSLVPVGFVLKFVNDNATAYFMTSGSDPIQICAPKPSNSRRYDVKIELSKINVKELCEAPLDDREEIWGKQAVTYASALRNGQRITKLSRDVVLWGKSKSRAKTTDGVKKGSSINVSKNTIIRGLTEEEVKSLEIWIGGKLYDWEFLGSVKYRCGECNEPQSNPYKRVIKLNSVTRNTEIDNLIPNEDFKTMTFGDDKFMELNYEEGSNICESKLKSLYKISIKTY